MKILTNFFYGAVFLFLLGIVGLFLASLLPLPGNIEIKIVKSGSMEPAIQTGGLIVIQPNTSTYGAKYSVGEIITFGKDTKSDIPTTHRVVSVKKENGKIFYIVKGDANEEADITPVPGSEVIGKVVFSLPYAGYVLDFAKQPVGFALLIGIPAGAIVLDESLAIFREVRKLVRRREERA